MCERTLARQMDFSSGPCCPCEGQHVGCSSFSSIPGGRASSVHLTGTTVSAGVPEEAPQTTLRRCSDLAAVCAPAPGAVRLLPRGYLRQGLHDPNLVQGSPPQYRQRRKGLWNHHLDPNFGWWCCRSLPLVDIGSCWPLEISGQDHSCYSRAISSGTAR